MYKCFLLIFLLLNFNLSAEIVKKIEVSGNNRINAETIKVYGEINLDEDYTSFDIDKILKNLYKTDFFEDIKISLNKNILSINVKEYSIINSINLKGEKSKKIKEAVLKFIKLKEKGSFILSKVSDDKKIIKDAYASQGFNFATVDAKVERFNNKRVNLIFFIDKGKKTHIAQINFTGDKKIKEKKLRDIIVSEENKFWKFLSKNTFLSANNIDLDKRLLINYYKSQGYYDVQVLSSNAEVSRENFTTLTYTINAGTRFMISKISTNVSEVLNKDSFLGLEDNFLKAVGKYYSPFTVKKLLDELDLLIVNADLQFIEHSVNEIIEDDNIEIKINIFEGKKLLVEKINIKGNTVTDETVIRSELLLDEGDPFNALKLDQSISKIKSRNLFSTVEKTIIAGANKDQKIIDITVVEKPTGEISAGAGLGTNGGSFAFTVTENNWMGKGVSVSTNLDISKETLTGGLSFTNQNFNLSGNSLFFFLKNTKNDAENSGFKNNIFSTGLGTSFEQYRDIYLAPSLVFSHDDLKVDSTGSKSLQKQKGKFTDLSFDYGITLDKRNRAFDPTEGYISRFRQVLPVVADSPSIKNTYNFSKYQTISEDMIGAWKFYGSTIHGLSNKDVRLSKRNFIPTSKLRGFEAGKIGPKDGIDFIGGNYAAVTNFELSLPNLLPESTKTDVGLFLDVGNLWEVDYDSSVDDSNKIRSSIGVNTSWISPVGPMTFVFSQNLTKASSDITESFNFRLGTTF